MHGTSCLREAQTKVLGCYVTSPRMSRQQWQSQCLSPGLLAPPHLLPLPAEPWSPLTHLLLSLHARGQQGMTQEQADAGSVREHCSRGRRIRAVCRHRVPGPACSSFSSCCRTDRWISVGILGRSVRSPLPQASQPQLTSWALSPGPSLGTQHYQPWRGEGLMDTGLGRVLWGLAGLPRTWGGWVVEWEEWEVILRVCPPCSLPSPSYRGASRPPTATYPTPGPAPATTTWQLWPPRPSWVSSGCLLLPLEPAQCPVATGGGKVRAELQLEGLQPCWTHKFLKARLHAGFCRA